MFNESEEAYWLIEVDRITGLATSFGPFTEDNAHRRALEHWSPNRYTTVVSKR